MFKRIISMVLERLIIRLAFILKAWIESETRKERSKKKHNENAEELKKAKTEKEKRDALERIARDFDD